MWKLREEIAELEKLKQEQLDAEMAQALALSEHNLARLDDSSTSSTADLWVDRYRPKRFADLLGDDVRILQEQR